MDAGLPSDVHRTVAIEARGGWSAGDTDRAYFVNILLDNPTADPSDVSQVTAGETFWIDTLIPGHGGFFSLGVSSAQEKWLEPGITVGGQLGSTDLYTAWEEFSGDDLIDSGSNHPGIFARQAQILVEPSARFMPWRPRPVYPYALVGLDVRFLGHPTVPTSALQPQGITLQDYDPRLLKHMPVTGLALGAGGRWRMSDRWDLDLDGSVIPTLFGTTQQHDTERPTHLPIPLPTAEGFVVRGAAGLRFRI